MFSRYCVLVQLNSAEGAHIKTEDLRRVIEYIQANNSGNISLATLASIAQVTPHHFTSLFTKATGQSPHKYVLRARIERAKLYLQDDTKSIADVGRLTGFRTQEHFTKVFRKIVGQTPSNFRQKSPTS